MMLPEDKGMKLKKLKTFKMMIHFRWIVLSCRPLLHFYASYISWSSPVPIFHGPSLFLYFMFSYFRWSSCCATAWLQEVEKLSRQLKLHQPPPLPRTVVRLQQWSKPGPNLPHSEPDAMEAAALAADVADVVDVADAADAVDATWNNKYQYLC